MRTGGRDVTQGTMMLHQDTKHADAAFSPPLDDNRRPLESFMAQFMQPGREAATDNGSPGMLSDTHGRKNTSAEALMSGRT